MKVDIYRRRSLQRAAALLTVSWLARQSHGQAIVPSAASLQQSLSGGSSARQAEMNSYASAIRQPSGSYALAILNQAGETLYQLETQDRGHGMAWQPARQILALFARRPGEFTWLWQFGAEQGKPRLVQTIRAAQRRHFYGHGVFSLDGRWLYATENNTDTLTGVIGVYDVDQGFARVGEYPTYGIGPHEIILCNDGETLAVCNGGIATHPAEQGGRKKLNLESMRSSVALINRRDGALLNQWQTPIDVQPEMQRLSWRHMALDRRGDIWIGGQYQHEYAGDTDTLLPLMACIRQPIKRLAAALQLPTLADITNAQLGQYIGSVSYSRQQDQLAFTAPRSDKLLLMRAADQRSRLLNMRDVTGVAASETLSGPAWLLSSGEGDWGQVQQTAGSSLSDAKLQRRNSALRFDNHLMRF